MIDLKTLHINGYAAMYRVIEISSSSTKPFGKRYFYNLIHHSALAYDVRG